jgi:serine/threonine-protein kinase
MEKLFSEEKNVNIDNFIEGKYKYLEEYLDKTYIPLYINFKDTRIQEIFSTIHSQIMKLFKEMEPSIPGGYFRAKPTRDLLNFIETTEELQNRLLKTDYAFNIDNYYEEIFIKCKSFLQKHGSTIPSNFEKVDIYYKKPLFVSTRTIKILYGTKFFFPIKLIGEGSYANVYKYKDTFYNRTFILKKAKDELDDKEIERFKKEFETMSKLKSPYIVEVYCYDEIKREYIMEYMDSTLSDYINENNQKLSKSERKSICFQIIKAFSYIHSKKMLHRDISPKNILIKCYDDNTKVVKISDFGLVRIPDSTLTTRNTEFKGFFNDRSLLEDFDKYSKEYETYALTKVIAFIMTGKINVNVNEITDKILKDFIKKGLNKEIEKRFQGVAEMQEIIKGF